MWNQTPNKIAPRLSHLRDQKFRHCFQDTLNSLCDCGNDTETTTHSSLPNLSHS